MRVKKKRGKPGGANAPFPPAVRLQERITVNRGRRQGRPGGARGGNNVDAAVLERSERLGVGARHLLDDSFGLLPVARSPARLQGRAVGEGVVPESCRSVSVSV